MTQWSELFPDGRTIFYEGKYPMAFAKEVKARFGFDPTTSERWTGECGYAFHCPPELLDAIYCGYPMGS